jgi:hypothetical protein
VTKFVTTGLQAETRAVIEAIHEAIAIPYAAATAHERTRAQILNERLMHTVVCLESLLRRDNAAELPRTLEYLREMLAKHPATGYVTWEQATARTEAGASWTDAVSLDYQDEEAAR